MSEPELGGEKSGAKAHPMRRVLRNFGLLVRGRGIAAVMAFGATTLMARSLGPTEFGFVVLMHAYALVVRGLVNVQPFEAVVRWGVPLHDSGDHEGVRRLLAASWRIDVYSSRIATLIGAGSAFLIGPALGLDGDRTWMLAAYNLVLLTVGNGTAKGILRLYDRFDAIGKQMAIGPTLRFLGVLAGWALSAPLPAFVAAWSIAYAAENYYMNWRGWKEYRLRHGAEAMAARRVPARLREFDGMRRFLWVTYWQSNLDLVPKHGATVLAGWLLGPAAAGLLRLALDLASLLSRPALLIRQVVFLDLTRSWNQGGQSFNVIAYGSALLGGGIGLLFVSAAWIGGEALLTRLFGPDFAGANVILPLMLLAASFDLAASPLRSAAYAIGHADRVLRLYAGGSVAYLLLFIGLGHYFGLIGVGIAASTAAALPMFGIVLLLHANRHVLRGDPDAPSRA